MPRDLFGDVTDPSVRVGSRSRYTVPLSFAAHLVVMAVVLLVPLMATGMLPTPRETSIFVAAPPPPAPPPPPRTAPPEKPLPVAPDAAPVETPAVITPETGLEAGFEQHAPRVDGGIGGTVVGVGSDALVPPPPPPPPPPPQPVIVGGKIAAPSKLRDVAPIYPALAQAARVQGMVILRATIDSTGQVIDLAVLKSIPLLDQAALDAVRQWQYSPTMLNGVPVPVVMTVTVSFALR